MKLITTQEAAKLLKVTPRTVERRAEHGIYKYEYKEGRGRGGRKMFIELESLPQETQDRYNGVTSEKDSSTESSPYLHMTDAQRELTAVKHMAVIGYKEFKDEYSGLDKMQAYLAKYNTEHPDKPITRRQLNHWENLYDREGTAGLLDRRGGYNRGRTDIPPQAWDLFRKYWLTEGRPTVESCVDIVADELGMNLPTAATFRRQIKKQIPLLARDYYRLGKKYHDDHHAPYNPRDYSVCHSNDWWIADHHVFDVAVLTPERKVVRPWLSAWEDLSSRMVVGYALNYIDPNSDIVLDSFARACYAHGIPNNIKIDNGKDFKAHDLFCTEFSMAICNEMHINVSCAIPFNAKAKPIERLFGTLEKRYCKHLPQYLSNDPKTRPAKMKKRNAQLVQDAMPWEEFKKFAANLIMTYNTTQHSALGGKTPLEAYRDGFVNGARVVMGEAALNMFLMRTTRLLKVGRNGVRVADIGHYFDCDALNMHRGESVYIRYNSDDVSKVYVFTEDNNFLCIATCLALCEYGGPVSMENIRELQRRKKARNKFIREQMPDVQPAGIEAYVARKAARYEDVQIDGKQILFNPVKHQHAEAIQRAEDAMREEQSPASARSNAQRDFEIEEAFYRHMTAGG